MQDKRLYLVVLIILIMCGYFVFSKYIVKGKQVAFPDYKNVEYVIDERKVTLVDGVSDVPGEANYESRGEADPSRMSLSMKKWKWIRAVYNDGTIITPLKQNKFTITFNNDGNFSATTDCNELGGAYATSKGKIYFSNIISTRMYCEGSQESVFRGLITDSGSYRFTSKGELILDLKFDSGSVTFR